MIIVKLMNFAMLISLQLDIRSMRFINNLLFTNVHLVVNNWSKHTVSDFRK
jgi:hypothetical protein